MMLHHENQKTLLHIKIMVNLSKVTLANDNSAQTVLYLFILMLPKVKYVVYLLLFLYNFVFINALQFIEMFKDRMLTGRNFHCLYNASKVEKAATCTSLLQCFQA
jgi:hypothetical protein